MARLGVDGVGNAVTLGGMPRAGARQTYLQRAFFSLMMLALLCAINLPFFMSPTQVLPDGGVRAGVADFAGASPDRVPVRLEGQWAMVWHDAPYAGQSFPISVPGTWAKQSGPDGKPLPAQASASYFVTLRGLPPGSYTLHLPTIFAASRVWVDGTLVSKRGVVGRDASDTRYEWRSTDIPLVANGKDIRLQVDVASYLHRRNGIEAAPVLGTVEAMRSWGGLRWAQEMLFQVALTVLGAISLAIFLFRRSDRVSLFVALGCFGFIPSTMMLGYDNLLLMLMPDLGLRAMLALVDLFGTASVIFALAYAHTLFPAESPRRVFWGLTGLVGLVWLIQAFNFTFSTILTTSQITAYGFWAHTAGLGWILVILIRAVIDRRDGAVPFLIGMGAMFASVSMISVVAFGVAPGNRVAGIDYTAFGVVIMLFSHLVVLAERWAVTINASEVMNGELQQLLEVSSSINGEMKLEALLEKIVEATSRILHTERSTLYLYDAEHDELWSMVAEGVEQKIIRIDAGKGLAGAAFRSGEVVAVADAYTDARFNPAVDAETGFVTRAVLSMPITTRDGRTIGVMQALNRVDGGSFTKNDEVRMAAFAAQSAIAIENATLFAEVVASRNYSESILNSMSAGVVTLDAEGRISKINPAAKQMLRLGDDPQANTAAAGARFAAANPWLAQEIASVARDGSVRNLIDVHVTVSEGQDKDANVSIVPLLAEVGQVGTLVLIDDISEGKRMASTMRRFMPQEVVQEVFSRGDDLIFGSAIPASVLFADIRSFTTLAETLTPRDTVDMLNEIFTELFEAVSSTSGMIDKYMGDAVMAVYGAPLPHIDDSANAVSGAIAMIGVTRRLNEGRVARGLVPLRLGIGIASGEVVAGTIGSPKRMDYTVIGDTVNLAARLQDATKIYRVNAIVCDGTAAKIAGRFPLRELDLMRVRGRKRPTRIFEIVDTGDLNVEGVAAYAAGMQFIGQRDWVAAERAFADAAMALPDDVPSAMMLQRVRHAQQEPPPADWDGVWG
ncbi:MAG: adenylate/guanylate cyclase domain-containing protein [Novosphingobium sp.]|uniref:adenylate/guanylate cyclase domain-containing protein n=1 Tax=Novosphingobium sp. TaxID=1874826 RepID=UPI003B9A74A1